MNYIIKYLLLICFLCSCSSTNKHLNIVSEVMPVTLKDYYLYEIEYKRESENFYGLFLSSKYYKTANKIISSSDYYIVDKVSFYTYFDMKEGNYSINDFEDCETKLNYEEDFLKTIENDKVHINIFKISGNFYYRNTYSGWYNNYSTFYIDIKRTKKIKVIYAVCE